MEHRFKAGDFLFFQLEAGFALARLLAVEEIENELVWHLMAFHDLFPDVESLETSIAQGSNFAVSIPHVALSNRAFESTQVADIGNRPVTEQEMGLVEKWRNEPGRSALDRSIRLLTGLR